MSPVNKETLRLTHRLLRLLCFLFIKTQLQSPSALNVFFNTVLVDSFHLPLFLLLYKPLCIYLLPFNPENSSEFFFIRKADRGWLVVRLCDWHQNSRVWRCKGESFHQYASRWIVRKYWFSFLLLLILGTIDHWKQLSSKVWLIDFLHNVSLQKYINNQTIKKGQNKFWHQFFFSVSTITCTCCFYVLNRLESEALVLSFLFTEKYGVSSV